MCIKLVTWNRNWTYLYACILIYETYTTVISLPLWNTENVFKFMCQISLGSRQWRFLTFRRRASSHLLHACLNLRFYVSCNTHIYVCNFTMCHIISLSTTRSSSDFFSSGFSKNILYVFYIFASACCIKELKYGNRPDNSSTHAYSKKSVKR